MMTCNASTPSGLLEGFSEKLDQWAVLLRGAYEAALDIFLEGEEDESERPGLH